jgi:hypothetical protein
VNFNTSTQEPVNTGNFQAFDKAVLGDKFETNQGTYDDFTKTAYDQATRTLDPTFDRMRKDFDQRAVNQGLSAGGEAYNTAFDQYSRQKNDAYGNAAFGAMQYGAGRLDADRGMNENQRQFDAAMLESGRTGDNSFLEGRRQFNMNDATQRSAITSSARTSANALSEQGRQFDRGSDFNELLGMEGIAQQYNNNTYRDAVFNSTQDQQQFNNMLTMYGLVPGASGGNVNTAGAFGNAELQNQFQQTQDANKYNAYGQLAQDLGNVDWKQAFASDDINPYEFQDNRYSYTDTGTGVQA